ncbi:MAG: hypothetical protein ACPGWR_01025 [Ardenticatenaceae bacterium]
MDPITLLMGAIVFAVAAMAEGVLNEEGLKLWDKMKRGLNNLFEGKPKAQKMLAEPSVSVERLKKELIAVKADQDEEIMEDARKLKELEEAQQAATESGSTVALDHGAAARDGGAAGTTGAVVIVGNVEGGINMGGRA